MNNVKTYIIVIRFDFDNVDRKTVRRTRIRSVGQVIDEYFYSNIRLEYNANTMEF
jgi:hypothetical protein